MCVIDAKNFKKETADYFVATSKLGVRMLFLSPRKTDQVTSEVVQTQMAFLQQLNPRAFEEKKTKWRKRLLISWFFLNMNKKSLNLKRDLFFHFNDLSDNGSFRWRLIQSHQDGYKNYSNVFIMNIRRKVVRMKALLNVI